MKTTDKVLQVSHQQAKRLRRHLELAHHVEAELVHRWWERNVLVVAHDKQHRLSVNSDQHSSYEADANGYPDS